MSISVDNATLIQRNGVMGRAEDYARVTIDNVMPRYLLSREVLELEIAAAYRAGYERGAQDKYVEMTTKTSDALEANT